MKQSLILLTIALTTLSLFAATAEARRFGGGGSFGKQRTMTPHQALKAPAAAPAPAQDATPAPVGNKWLGPLTGLAIGASLGALFASMGLSEGMGTILMIMLAVMAVFFLVSSFSKRRPQGAPGGFASPLTQRQHAMQHAGAGAPYGGAQPHQTLSGGGTASLAAADAAARNIPADFPAESFLRSAKTSFIRLQAANDRKDLNDIREYTTPEMFAEISMQMQERGDIQQRTDVVAITGELLEVATEDDLAIASVRFTGQLRENNGTPQDVDEIWHVQKNLRDDKSVWLLAGIQQTTLH